MSSMLWYFLGCFLASSITSVFWFIYHTKTKPDICGTINIFKDEEDSTYATLSPSISIEALTEKERAIFLVHVVDTRAR